MKSFEISIEPIIQEHIQPFFIRIKEEPQIDGFKPEDWIGEQMFDIFQVTKDKKIHVGYITFSNWGDGAYCLSCIYIIEGFRHKGIGSAAIRKLQNKLKRCRLFYGFVHKDNEKAIEMYKKLGFKYLSNNRIYDLDYPSIDKCKDAMQGEFYEFGKELKIYE